MLINETLQNQYGAYIMSDTAIITAMTVTTIHEVAQQAAALGTGLLNAAPGEKSGQPNDSVLYLLETSELLNKIAEECEKIGKNGT